MPISMQAGVIAAGLLMATVVPAAGAETAALDYDIRKDGEPIGREQVRISRQDGGAVVEVETHTRAKVLFLEFHYDHRRREEWQGAKLLRMVANTDDDGAKSHLDAVQADGGWRLTVNGQASQRPGDLLPLTLWGRAVVGKNDLFSIIDAKPYRVNVASVGVEQVNVGGKTVPAEHVRMTGDVERDLWYGDDGYLLRAAFQRSGYAIEVVRKDR